VPQYPHNGYLYGVRFKPVGPLRHIKRTILSLGIALGLSISLLPAANAETLTFPCGNGGTYTVVMPAGAVIEGKKCGGAVALDSSVKIIDSDAFSFGQLTSILIPNSVTEIGEGAFEKNYGLNSVLIGNSVKSIGASAFRQAPITSLVLGNSVVSIGKSAFSGSQLTEVTIPNSVTVIGDSAFGESPVLSSVVMGNSVFSVNGFSNNPKLKSVVFGNSVRLIAPNAFANSGLTSIDIPSTIEVIYSDAFSGTQLTAITVPNSVTTIGDRAFANNSKLTSIVIGNSVTKIGEGAFANNSQLTSIVFGNSASRIGPNAFANNPKLTSVTVGNSVVSIGEGAFANNPNLTSVVVGNSVISIGERAFAGNTALKSVSLPDTLLDFLPNIFERNFSLSSILYCNTFKVLPITPTCPPERQIAKSPAERAALEKIAVEKAAEKAATEKAANEKASVGFQSIVISPSTIGSVPYNLKALPLNVSATSNLPVSAYNNTNYSCEYKNNFVVIKESGRCVIAFDQQGNSEFKPAKTVLLEFIIESAPKKTITCIKGKTTKKVSAVKPSCPVGYKKK
jgi:hypothetical protein